MVFLTMSQSYLTKKQRVTSILACDASHETIDKRIHHLQRFVKVINQVDIDELQLIGFLLSLSRRKIATKSLEGSALINWLSQAAI